MNLTMMKRIANRSNHKLYNHAALIFSGSRLLAYGYNHEQTHAEISAIRRFQRLYRPGNSRPPSNLHLISFMVKKSSSNIGNSKPCLNCRAAMIDIGIRWVTYFEDGKVYQYMV
jgi:deoxycytidylate deaminase